MWGVALITLTIIASVVVFVAASAWCRRRRIGFGRTMAISTAAQVAVVALGFPLSAFVSGRSLLQAIQSGAPAVLAMAASVPALTVGWYMIAKSRGAGDATPQPSRDGDSAIPTLTPGRRGVRINWNADGGVLIDQPAIMPASFLEPLLVAGVCALILLERTDIDSSSAQLAFEWVTKLLTAFTLAVYAVGGLFIRATVSVDQHGFRVWTHLRDHRLFGLYDVPWTDVSAFRIESGARLSSLRWTWASGDADYPIGLTADGVSRLTERVLRLRSGTTPGNVLGSS